MGPVSPRVPKAARLRPVDPDDEPEVVRAPPEPSGDDADDGEQRRGGRAVRAPAEGGAVRAPPDRGTKRAGGGRQPGRGAAAPPRKNAAPDREPVVEINAPGEVVLPAEDDAPPRRPTAPRVVVDSGDAAAVAPPDDERAPAVEAAAPAPPRERTERGRSMPKRRRPRQPTATPRRWWTSSPASTRPPSPRSPKSRSRSTSPEAEEEEEETVAAEPERKPKEPERVQAVEGETAEFPDSARVWAGVTPPTRRGSSSRFLTDVIVEMDLVAKDTMDEAIEKARAQGSTPERVLVDSGTLAPDGLARALAERYGLDHIDVSVFPIDPAAVSLINDQAAKRYQAVPVAYVDKRTLLVAMADPSNVLAVDDIAIMTGCEVRVAVASPQDIGDLISRMDRLGDVVAEPEAGLAEEEEEGADAGEIVNIRETAEDAPVVKLVNQIVAQAVEQGASDVHFAPTEGTCACASAWTACCGTSRPCRGAWWAA